jgi:hypothetical protein
MKAVMNDADIVARILEITEEGGTRCSSTGRLVDGVRAAFDKGIPAPSKDDVRRLIDRLIDDRRLKRFGHQICQIRVIEEAPDPAAQERVRRFTHRCLFPYSKKTTFEDIRNAVSKRFMVLERTNERLAFRWSPVGDASRPTFYLSECTLDDFAESVRATVIRRTSTGCAALSFDHLEEVLDEANGLIESQCLIQSVTKRPYFLVWNGRRVDP